MVNAAESRMHYYTKTAQHRPQCWAVSPIHSRLPVIGLIGLYPSSPILFTIYFLSYLDNMVNRIKRLSILPECTFSDARLTGARRASYFISWSCHQYGQIPDESQSIGRANTAGCSRLANRICQNRLLILFHWLTILISIQWTSNNRGLTYMNSKFADTLRIPRKERGLTQKQLGKELLTKLRYPFQTGGTE
jgi:hypothetical protein